MKLLADTQRIASTRPTRLLLAVALGAALVHFGLAIAKHYYHYPLDVVVGEAALAGANLLFFLTYRVRTTLWHMGLMFLGLALCGLVLTWLPAYAAIYGMLGLVLQFALSISLRTRLHFPIPN